MPVVIANSLGGLVVAQLRETAVSTSLDLVILLLRVGVIFLLYFFLYQVVRVLRGELQVAGTNVAVNNAAGGVTGPAANPYGKLVMSSPGETALQPGYPFELGAVNVIGRRPDSDIPLNDSFMSGEHALLEWRGDSWWLEDQHSTNGTFVNDIEVRDPTPVTYGDFIRVGRVELKLTR
ncbi:MAG TPA: FHA domain-containing protein [Herpetosiphonaceae bacterium]